MKLIRCYFHAATFYSVYKLGSVNYFQNSSFRFDISLLYLKKHQLLTAVAEVLKTASHIHIPRLV